jgi:F-type H+-transporting ATPase subunit epsilon
MKLSVTTPTGALVETDADEVIAPGVLGEFGVLPGHIPFLSALRPGVLSFRGKGEKDDQGSGHVYAVGEGVLEVARAADGTDKVIVLVERAVTAGEIDRDAASKEAAAADSELAGWKKDLDGEWKALASRRAWAQARVDAAVRAGR